MDRFQTSNEFVGATGMLVVVAAILYASVRLDLDIWQGIPASFRNHGRNVGWLMQPGTGVDGYRRNHSHRWRLHTLPHNLVLGFVQFIRNFSALPFRWRWRADGPGSRERFHPQRQDT